MRLNSVLVALLEEKDPGDTVRYINIVGAEIAGNQIVEKILKLDVASVMDGSVRKTFMKFINEFTSGGIEIKFVVKGKTIQINTLKKDEKITFVETELSAVDETEYAGIKNDLKKSNIKYTEEGKKLKISNSAGYTEEQVVNLIINIIKIVANNRSE